MKKSFKDILVILKDLAKLPEVNAELIMDTFKKNDIIVQVFGKQLHRIYAFEIYYDQKIYLITEMPINYYKKKVGGRLTDNQKRMSKLFLPIPLHYMALGKILKSVHGILQSEKPYERANQWLLETCSNADIAIYFNKFFCKSKYLAKYKGIILESIEAFFYGLDQIATISLIPVFEGGLRSLLLDIDNQTKPKIRKQDDFDNAIKRILLEKARKIEVSKYSWYSAKECKMDIEIDFFTYIHPAYDAINSFRTFFNDVFYKAENPVESKNLFNRNLIIHMLKDNLNLNESANFVRLIILLSHIAFIEGLYNQNIPLLWPGLQSDDEALLRHFQFIVNVSKLAANTKSKL